MLCTRATSPAATDLCAQQMTYVKQLENYEEAVIQKRIEEMAALDQQLTDDKF